jgi:CheY-like chemotaxis protein/tetratricopeptide (TPR) repeat protein
METTQTKNRLLLVDGDPKSLRVLDVSLKKAGFEVTTATSGREALASLAAELPDLIISDTDLDEMDGFELCNLIKANPDWAKIPFLFVSGRKSIEDKIRGLELGVDDYLTKPIYIKEIGIRVRTALQRAEREHMESRREGRTRFAGQLSDVGVVDLVQTIELNRKSGIVHIVNRDERRGSIFFRDGKVIDAEVGRLSGAHALYRLFSWSDGQFAVEFKHIRRHDVIDMSMAALLMEGMRRLDEGTRLLDNLPPTSGVLEVDCRVLAEELAELPDEMNSVLRLCDGARTLQEVVEDSDLPDLETLGIINKLFADQIIFARQAPERGAEAAPGVRLANWLSEGAAEELAASGELRASSEIPLPADLAGDDEIRSAPVPAPSTGSDLSAEETLGAALPSRVEASLADDADLGKAADTLRGIPVENLFGEPEARPVAEAHAEVAVPDNKTPAEGGEEPRPTKPMGLAERLLSGDSVLRTAAMHEALSEGDGSVQEPLALDRHTQRYGDPAAEAAAALVQEVVSSTHGSKSQAIPPAEPERPSKEVDWGAWPAVAPPESHPEAMAAPAPAKPTADAPAAVKPEDSKTSGAELDTADLEEVESGDVQSMADKPAEPPADSAQVDPQPVEEAATRLGPEDVLPMDGEPPAESERGLSPTAASGSAESNDAQSAGSLSRESAEITRLVRKPRQVRQLMLMALAAFALGTVGALALMNRTSQPGEPLPAAPPPAASPTVATSALSPPPAAPAAPPPTTPPPAAAAGVQVAPSTGAAVAPNPSPVAPPPAAATATTPSGTLKTGNGEPAAATPSPAAGELRQNCIDVDAGGKGKARAVLAACRRALEADAKDAEVMVILSRAEIDRGRLGEARSLARKALVADPARADAYVFLGTAEQEAGKLEEARAAYKKYLELAPDGRFAREIRAILNNL